MKPFKAHTASLLLVCLLSACSKPADVPLAPSEVTKATACSLDGMVLADYPGPKAQIHYEGQALPDFFCDTTEMLSMYLRPEQARKVKGIFVQDMGKTDWNSPQGAWISAQDAYFVFGSKKHGSMGPTAASFGSEADANKFAAEHGGKVLAFAQVTADMVRLDGGALHDHRM